MPLLARAAAVLVLAIAGAMPVSGQPVAPAWVPAAPPEPGTAIDLADRDEVAGQWPAARIAQADRDRVLDPFAAFGSVLGRDFAPAFLPVTTQLLTDILYAASAAVVEAKEHFTRLRPFVADRTLARCPDSDLLDPDRSWPSGHAAIGYAWAVVLADLVPARAERILERGRDYGTSRVVCGFHWPSDVAEGQGLGQWVAQVMLADPRFSSLLADARTELGRLIAP